MEQLVHNALYVDIVYALMWNVVATVAIAFESGNHCLKAALTETLSHAITIHTISYNNEYLYSFIT